LHGFVEASAVEEGHAAIFVGKPESGIELDGATQRDEGFLQAGGAMQRHAQIVKERRVKRQAFGRAFEMRNGGIVVALAGSQLSETLLARSASRMLFQVIDENAFDLSLISPFDEYQDQRFDGEGMAGIARQNAATEFFSLRVEICRVIDLRKTIERREILGCRWGRGHRCDRIPFGEQRELHFCAMIIAIKSEISFAVPIAFFSHRARVLGSISLGSGCAAELVGSLNFMRRLCRHSA
jgi:hypothetical protein